MTDDMESARLRARLAEMAAQCEMEAEAWGDERFRRAAGVLRGKRSGRRAVDDTKALAYAEKLIDGGCSKNKSCIQAAMVYSPNELAFDATKARLLRKVAQN